MTVKCVFGFCGKTWDKYDRNTVIIHHRDDHQGNLMFCSDEDLKLMVLEVDKS